MSAQTGIVIAADFTADPIRESIAFWNRELGWGYDLEIAPYNQVIQALIDPVSAFHSNGGVNVVLTLRCTWRPGIDSC